MAHQNHGPFQIDKCISPPPVRITLPRAWKIDNVFHVSLLEPYRTSDQRKPPNPAKALRDAEEIEYSEEYEMDKVLSAAKKGQRILYLVKWLGYPDRKDGTNKPYENFSEARIEGPLRLFHQKNPDTPKDYR